jgi:tRNA threonylcarbamoyladenosine biosynthesis protein TsaB
LKEDKSMNILAIETTGAEASVALIDELGNVSMEASDQKLNHLQNLMPMTDTLLTKRGLKIDDINCIAVSEGPGSFTGIRIGVSSARALAQTLGLKTIGVPTLKSFLYNVPEYRGIICPIFDARRSQVYGGAYRWIGTGEQKAAGGQESAIGQEEVVPGAAYDLSELLGLLENTVKERGAELVNMDGGSIEITFFGDGIVPYREQIQKWQDTSLNNNIRVLFAEDDIKLQKAASVVRLALELWKEGKTRDLNDLKPVYMRKAEAERKLEEKA